MNNMTNMNNINNITPLFNNVNVPVQPIVKNECRTISFNPSNPGQIIITKAEGVGGVTNNNNLNMNVVNSNNNLNNIMFDTSIYIIYMVNNTYIVCIPNHEKLKNLRKKIIFHTQWVYVDAQTIYFDYIKWLPTFIKLLLVFLLVVQWLFMLIYHIVIAYYVLRNIWGILVVFKVFLHQKHINFND